MLDKTIVWERAHSPLGPTGKRERFGNSKLMLNSRLFSYIHSIKHYITIRFFSVKACTTMPLLERAPPYICEAHSSGHSSRPISALHA